MELGLRLGAPRAPDATGFKQRGAKPLGELAKRLAIAAGARLGHALESIGWEQLSVHGAGGRRRSIALRDLLPPITRPTRASRWHFRHDTLGFLAALQAALAEPCMLGKGAHLLDVPWDISGNALAVAAHPALEIDNMVVVAEATHARLDLCTVLSETRGLTAGRCERWLGVLQAHGVFWEGARTTLCGLVTCTLWVGLPPFELLPGCGDSLVGRPLFGGHGTGDCFDQLVLPMAQVGGVVRLEILFHRGEQAGRFLAGRLDHPAMALGQDR